MWDGVVGEGEVLEGIHEAGAGDAECHGVGLVAVDAGDWVLDEGVALVIGHVACLLVGDGAEGFEAFGKLFPGLGVGDAGFGAEVAVGGEHGGVAVEAGAGLVELFDALGFVLVDEHVGVAALFAVVDGKGVAVKDGAPEWVGIEFLEGLAAAVACAFGIDGAAVALVLAGVVLCPLGGVVGGFVDIDHLKDVLACLGFALHDIVPECHGGNCAGGCEGGNYQE